VGIDLLFLERSVFEAAAIYKFWKMIPLCLMWHIQRERNARNFKDCEDDDRLESHYVQISLCLDGCLQLLSLP
jgi:hypothetical protein